MPTLVAHAQAAPASPPATSVASSGRSVAWRSVMWGLIVLLGLEVWRPFFFLTDDNLVGLLPILTSVGRSLVHGQSPFVVGTIFGGLDLLHDPGSLCLWNPLVLALALLTQTPARLAVVDIFVGFHLLLAAFCMAHLLDLWRRMFGLRLSDRRLIFISASYGLSAFAIIVCASWNSFSANIAAAPLALLGLFHPRRRSGVTLVLASTLLSILAGHLSPFAWAALSITAFAALWPWASRRARLASTCGRGLDWEVPLRWAVGSALGIALCSPLLWLAAGGFAQTARDTSLATSEAISMRLPAETFALSWLAGSLSALSDAGRPFLILQLPSGASHAIAAAAASWFILLSILPGRSRRWTPVDWMFATLCAGVVLLVARPDWMQSIIGRLPLLRSLRYPFREVWLLHLWTHAWMAWRGQSLASPRARLAAVGGSCVLALSLLAWAPPTFSRLHLTRDWVISGRADAFWERVRPQLSPKARLLPTATREQWEHYERLPWPLLCAFNLPALFDVPSSTGYVIRGIEHGAVRRGELDSYGGLRSPHEGAEALRRDPNVVLVRFESLSPLAVRFEGRGFRRVVLVD